MSSTQFFEPVKARRSVYMLKKESVIDDKKIQDIVAQALLHVPTSFNSQTTKMVLLLKGEHDKLWDITRSVLKAIVPEDAWEKTGQKMDMFQNAYGTVLFYDDRTGISEMQKKFPIFSEQFPTWATQANAMAQFAIWTAFAAEGLGANLQHYNPLIDEKVAATWGIPSDWELNAMLVFGTPAAPAQEKTFGDIKERFKVFGA